MALSKKMMLLVATGLAIPAVTMADVPHQFQGGKKAIAAQVNANFKHLDQRLSALEQVAPTEVAIDCSADGNALQTTELQNNTAYTLTGMCNGPIWISNRHNVTIQGDAAGSKDDGVLLQAGLVDNPYGAIAVWESTAVKLNNLTLSSANYVSQTYGFGDNVATLIASGQSHVDASNIDFLGGDYSVGIYNGSQLNLREGIRVTGFNRRGLDAYNHGLIRVHEDIMISGIVGSSTDTYPYAIAAIGNSIVDVKNGGSYSGASGQPVDDYATAVWAGDNSTIRFANGDNPATVTGSIESAYSSMIRISGNMTLNGTIAAYHRGYIRATGVTQSGGEVYAGDAATIRFESSSLAPTSVVYPNSPLEVYRQGNLRINDTTIDLGGNDIYLSGFAVFNARGASDLGGANINCHDPNQASISGSVTGVGTVFCAPVILP